MRLIESVPLHVYGFSALQRAENSSIHQSSRDTRYRAKRFSALQRAENSSIVPVLRRSMCGSEFQCSSASRKFLNSASRSVRDAPGDVSVLFSEPKIPQFSTIPVCTAWCWGFSALQRAENSSIVSPGARSSIRFPFQCSSASRKFLNLTVIQNPRNARTFQCSSASRKFLNVFGDDVPQRTEKFQCSSASRKFLNHQKNLRGAWV